MAEFSAWANFVDDIDDVRSNLTLHDFVPWDSKPPCDITATFRHTIGQPAVLLGGDSVLSDAEMIELTSGYEPGPMLLFNPGCDENDGDCDQNAICSSTATLFRSWETLWTCLSLAGMALASQSFPVYFNASMADQLPDRYNDSNYEHYRKYDYYYDFGEVTDALRPLGFNLSSIAGFDALRVYNLTFECAQASCQQWRGEGYCSLDYPQGSPFRIVDDGNRVANSTQAGLIMADSLEQVCDDLPTLNADIAGPGVLASYMIQSIFVVAIWGLLRIILVEKTIDFVMAPFLWVTWGKEGARESFTSFYPRFQSLLRGIEHSNPFQSTIILVIDFQEAQCFFLLAIQIGVLFATNQGVEFHASATMFSLEENRRAAHDLASLGIALVCVVQMTISRLKMDSIYTLLLSTFTVGLAAATMKHGFSRQRMAEIVASLADSMAVKECGDYGSLRFQCMGDTSFVGIQGRMTEFRGLNKLRLAASFSSLVVIWGIKVFKELTRRGIVHYIKKRYQWQSTWAARLRVDVWLTVLVPFIQFGLEFFLTYTVVASSFDLFAHVRNQLYPGMVRGVSSSRFYRPPQSWNIGQILAILVWAPVVFKFLYVLIRGLEKGFRMRFSSLFELRRNSDEMRDIIQIRPPTSTDSLELTEQSLHIGTAHTSSAIPP